MYLKLFLAAISLLQLSGVSGSPYIISDDRIRSLDTTPMLGRGYSIMTNSFQSTCLMVDETTIPSYNYDYSFYNFISSGTLELDLAAQFSHSFGYPWLKKEMSAQQPVQGEARTMHFIASSMRIERYYSSVREEISPLGDYARTLIERQDYVGFFKACGPSYVRGIRRAQETVAFFLFESSSDERAAILANNIGTSTWLGSVSNTNDSSAELASMKIYIQGYGLGLSGDGSETLLARSLDDFNKVMKFAFKTMTVNHSFHIGMVYGMEVSPWVENTAFQVASNVLDEVIEIPLTLSLIPRAINNDDPDDRTFNNEERENYSCNEPAFEMDKYGFCCELGALYNDATREYNGDVPEERVCRPMRILDPVFIKDNMASNGEYVARLDQLVRYKLNQLSTLERCISAAKAIPSRYDFYILKPQDTVKYDRNTMVEFTVYELKMTLDPFDDYAMVKQMAKELDEFLDMFIMPCYAALFGTSIGNSPETDPTFFMAYPWHAHDECSRLSCLGNSMRWDRSNPEGGCVPSMISGADSPNYSGGDANCNMDIRGQIVDCKHSTDELNALHVKMTNAWSTLIPRGRVDFFMDGYCLPELQNEEISIEAKDVLRANHLKMFGGSDLKRLNVAVGKPATQTSNYGNHYGWYPYASLAVDGNTSGNFWHKTVTHTLTSNNPFWEVDLKQEYTVNQIKVYSRQDCCSQVIKGYKVQLYKEGQHLASHDRDWNDAEEARRSNQVEPINTFDYIQGVDPLSGVVADKVRISMTGNTHIMLAEVEVYALVDQGDLYPNYPKIYVTNYSSQVGTTTDGNTVKNFDSGDELVFPNVEIKSTHRGILLTYSKNNDNEGLVSILFDNVEVTRFYTCTTHDKFITVYLKFDNPQANGDKKITIRGGGGATNIMTLMSFELTKGENRADKLSKIVASAFSNQGGYGISGPRITFGSIGKEIGPIVGWNDSGDFMEYSDVYLNGARYLKVWYADGYMGGRVRILINGVEKAVWTVPYTGGWFTFREANIFLGGTQSGVGTVRFEMLDIAGVWNLAWFQPIN